MFTVCVYSDARSFCISQLLINNIFEWLIENTNLLKLIQIANILYISLHSENLVISQVLNLGNLGIQRKRVCLSMPPYCSPCFVFIRIN